MLPREDSRDSHWRQPWTSDSVALGSEMKTRYHPIGRATDICQGRVVFTAGLSKPAPFTVNVFRVFPATRESKECSRLFSQPFGSIPCVASSATTWVNLPSVGGQPTRIYQVRQWACNRHSVHGSIQRYSTGWKAAHGELFHRCRSPLLDCSGKT